MPEREDIAARHARTLARLSELGLELAERIALDALTAATPQARAEFSRGFHMVSRSVRQSVALEARLAAAEQRKAEQARREPPPPEPEDLSAFHDPARIARRKDEARAAVQRVIWSETEGEEQDYLFDLLDQRLDLYAYSPTYGMDPLDAHIAFLCRQLGLSPEAAQAWRDLPDPVVDESAEGDRDPDEDDDEDPEPATTTLSEYDAPAASIDWRSSA